jgi:hypothetical protein
MRPDFSRATSPALDGRSIDTTTVRVCEHGAHALEFREIAAVPMRALIDQLILRIGDFDLLSIRWGYSDSAVGDSASNTGFADARLQEQESRLEYQFSALGALGSDPNELAESVGDRDLYRSANLGLANLRRTAEILPTLTDNTDRGLKLLGELYDRLLAQLISEVRTVIPLIGGAAASDHVRQGPRFLPIGSSTASAALHFVAANSLVAPSYLTNPRVDRRLEAFGNVERIA